MNNQPSQGKAVQTSLFILLGTVGVFGSGMLAGVLLYWAVGCP